MIRWLIHDTPTDLPGPPRAAGTWHLAPGTWHLAPGTWHLAPASQLQHMPPTYTFTARNNGVPGRAYAAHLNGTPTRGRSHSVNSIRRADESRIFAAIHRLHSGVAAAQ